MDECGTIRATLQEWCCLGRLKPMNQRVQLNQEVYIIFKFCCYEAEVLREANALTTCLSPPQLITHKAGVCEPSDGRAEANTEGTLPITKRAVNKRTLGMHKVHRSLVSRQKTCQRSLLRCSGKSFLWSQEKDSSCNRWFKPFCSRLF
ncbi:unnamed protein product [Moneuplotes crassus]|uniref:Uncharacterized protein n=1 Tax=Euplotes crassus TaxID=5936 RepID=A0AAD1XW81_EUPCR|nr:unnamed protein product [Moneuplotes crassus]